MIIRELVFQHDMAMKPGKKLNIKDAFGMQNHLLEAVGAMAETVWITIFSVGGLRSP